MKQVERKSAAAAHKSVDWRSKMSDHVAYALLVYTGLQIFMTVNALKDGASSILPYFALILLVGFAGMAVVAPPMIDAMRAEAARRVDAGEFRMAISYGYVSATKP